MAKKLETMSVSKQNRRRGKFFIVIFADYGYATDAISFI